MAKDLEAEKSKTDALLSEMLPGSVAQQLKSGQSVDASSFIPNMFNLTPVQFKYLTCKVNENIGVSGEYEEATVMFSDVPSFQQIVPHCAPKDVVLLLNDLFTKFDRLVVLQNVRETQIPRKI